MISTMNIFSTVEDTVSDIRTVTVEKEARNIANVVRNALTKNIILKNTRISSLK